MDSKKQKFKSFLLWFWYIGSIFAMIAFLLLSTKSIVVNRLEYIDNELHIEYELMEEMGEYLIEYSDNIFFINSEKIYSLSNNASITDISCEQLYVRVKPIKENFVQSVTKIYVLKNHDHIYQRNENLTVLPKCKTDGWFVDCCIDCDSTIKEAIPMLGCSNYIVGYKSTSCTEDGYTRWRCERCGEFDTVTSPKVDHAFAFTEALSKSTCVVQGESKFNCIGCGEEKIEKIALTSHNYAYSGESVSGSNIIATSKCTVCGKGTSKSIPLQYSGSFTGLFIMPAYNYYLPIYVGDPYAAQVLVDNPNSGCLVNFIFTKIVLADHAHQGFSVTKKAVPGSTVAYYAGQKYICTSKFQGTNTKSDLVDKNGVSINAMSGELYTYVCNDWSSSNVTIVGWNRV